MSLSRDIKAAVVQGYATHVGDTGSPEVQVALLTTRIEGLADHITVTALMMLWPAVTLDLR